jgi:hypothetical protein
MTPLTRTSTVPSARKYVDVDWTGPFPRLTEEEKQQALEAMERAWEFQERLLAERGGVPFPESWPLIREAREEQ